MWYGDVLFFEIFEWDIHAFSRYRDLHRSLAIKARSDLLRDVFVSVISYAIIEMTLALKKTQGVYQEASDLNKVIMNAFSGGTEKSNQEDSPSKKNSSSSQTSTQSESGALKKLSELKSAPDSSA